MLDKWIMHSLTTSEIGVRIHGEEGFREGVVVWVEEERCDRIDDDRVTATIVCL